MPEPKFGGIEKMKRLHLFTILGWLEYDMSSYDVGPHVLPKVGSFHPIRISRHSDDDVKLNLTPPSCCCVGLSNHGYEPTEINMLSC